MRRTILVLSVLLALAGTAPASAAFLAANSPPGEKLLDTGCLKVFGDLSRELPPGSGGSWLERAAECFVAPGAGEVPPEVPPEAPPEVPPERPDLGTPGTLRNPDGTLKNPVDQLEQVEEAQRRGRLIDSVEKSRQNLNNKLRGPYDPNDWE
ncbi:MAG: hypothetical protein ABSG86_32415 [Thermoguttaceae bacterium]